ncbi:hypothetical protein CK203_006810 [Vitis vinifera]|uniref:Uncharacterized protein n=1 Tax=Vitis vinifera TaxID=29760 RepID=A0A438KCA4_VITVI|nr:hypothetical protein CK203_006810 [Vitis vinifera]
MNSIQYDYNQNLVLDYDDLMRIPLVNDYIKETTRDAVRPRAGFSGEVGNENLFVPVLFPKGLGIGSSSALFFSCNGESTIYWGIGIEVDIDPEHPIWHQIPVSEPTLGPIPVGSLTQNSFSTFALP